MRFPLGLLCFAALAAAQDTSLRTVIEAFRRAGIPGDLTINFNPTALLEVTFPQTSGRQVTIHAGQQLPRNATAGPPTFSVAGARSRGPFVIAAVDPDAPTPQTPTSAQIRHFLGGNFAIRETGDRVEPLRNATAAITNFRQPTPPAGSDAHRYIFLLFNQPEGFNRQTIVTPTTSTALFNISAFGDAVGLGDPIAGTFMLVAPDPPAA